MLRKKLTATETIAMGFGFIIIVGALLLMLPLSNKSGEAIPFLNALFTATSATCVTGLVVYDTWTQFTLYGQVVILLLIQIGGLGFMTIAILFFFVLKKRIGLRERTLLTEAVSAMRLGGIVRLVKRILIGTLAIESVGTILLALRFCPRFGFWKGLWYGVFHSISSFCNAGFDLMGTLEPYSSLVHFADDIVVNLTVSSLIVVGGIGFVVWNDIRNKGIKFRNYELHSKVVLSATAILILVSAVSFFITERDASMSGMSVYQRVLASLFQAVTPRTAGFNTIDMRALSNAGTLLTMGLMFVGAAPGSTGGGNKVSTFTVMLLAVASYMRGREDVDVFQRRLEPTLIRRAFCSALFYFLFSMTAVFVICSTQTFALKDVIFEVLSALGTGGLTAGITVDLSSLSRFVIILLMYSGRIGSLAVIISATENRKTVPMHYPVEKIIIG
jgi:trk system potassium uptake protein TrkH